MQNFESRKEALTSEFRNSQHQVRLGKDTSNLFRDRESTPQSTIDVRSFKHVLDVDTENSYVETEGMVPYDDLARATLAHNHMPCVVPQLKSITIGGAISGIGIESSSFRYGLVHESVLEMDVLTGNGDVVTCTPENEHQDLFFGIPNSYGTLGYILKLKAEIVPVKPFVKLSHSRFSDTVEFFQNIKEMCNGNIDFLDGVMFEPGEFYITTGCFTDDVPYQSDYTYEHIYFKSIRQRQEDYLTTHDYIWRWDTDWFWCSKNVGAQSPLLRPLFGRKRLNSVFYTQIMRWNARWGFTRYYNRMRGVHTESVIQDVDVPIERAHEFYDFFSKDVGIRPVWICPVGSYKKQNQNPLFPMNPDQIYVNFGFWDVVRGKEAKPEGHFNKLIEDKVNELGGIKSLYSDTYYPEDRFWNIYNYSAYQALKEKYDSHHRLKNLYEKCVLRG